MIQDTTLKYYDLLAKDRHHRYKSWEHIYLFFKENHKQLAEEKIKDHASLHLAFYLASWGMLRGGSFLLQKDYKIHTYFIEAVAANPKYWIFYNDEIIQEDEYIALVAELIEETTNIYREAVTEINGKKKSVEITDTLVTKILLGVYGNVPAYDRYFKTAVKVHGFSATLGKKSLQQIFAFYKSNEADFNQVAETIDKEVAYPPMKLIDMYFFNYGVLMDKRAQEELSSAGAEVVPVDPISEAENIILERQRQQAFPKGKGTIVQAVRDFIVEKLAGEKAAGAKFVDLKSGDIHRQMNFKNRLPIVCQAMRSIPEYKAKVIHETSSRNSSTNVVRYYFD